MRELVPLTPDGAESLSATNTSRLRSTEAGKWPDIVLQLAEEFGSDLDLLKRHHVCTLYSAGFDKLAEEVSTMLISS